MKNVTFPCGSTLSDGMGWECSFDLTDEEYELLKSKKDEVFHLSEDPELEEIENKVLEEVIQNEIDNVRSDPSFIEFYVHDDTELEMMQEQGYRNFVDCCDDNALRSIIEENCSFYVNMPYNKEFK